MVGFFSSTAAADPSLVPVLLRPPDNKKWQQKAADKALAKESEGILLALQNGEYCVAVAHDLVGVYGDVLVVTDRRVFNIKRAKVRQSLTFAEIADTQLGVKPSGEVLVSIWSHEARLDYSPNDPMRMTKVIMASVPTPRIAQTLSAEIDARIPASST